MLPLTQKENAWSRFNQQSAPVHHARNLTGTNFVESQVHPPIVFMFSCAMGLNLDIVLLLSDHRIPVFTRCWCVSCSERYVWRELRMYQSLSHPLYNCVRIVAAWPFPSLVFISVAFLSPVTRLNEAITIPVLEPTLLIAVSDGWTEQVRYR